MNDNRDYQKEKFLLKMYVWITWIFDLIAVTGFFYIFLFLYLKLNPNLNVYYFLIFGGIIGGFWGVGIDEAYSFSMWVKYGNDLQKRYDWVNENKSIEHWYKTEESFFENLRWLKKRAIWSLIFVIIVGFVIGFFRIY